MYALLGGQSRCACLNHTVPAVSGSPRSDSVYGHSGCIARMARRVLPIPGRRFSTDIVRPATVRRPRPPGIVLQNSEAIESGCAARSLGKGNSQDQGGRNAAGRDAASRRRIAASVCDGPRQRSGCRCPRRTPYAGRPVIRRSESPRVRQCDSRSAGDRIAREGRTAARWDRGGLRQYRRRAFDVAAAAGAVSQGGAQE